MIDTYKDEGTFAPVLNYLNTTLYNCVGKWNTVDYANIITRLRSCQLRNQGSITSRGRMCLSSQYPGGIWDRHKLLPGDYRGLFLQDKAEGA